MTEAQFEALNTKLVLVVAGVWTIAAWLTLEALGRLLTAMPAIP